jgi:hypothetical protein
MSEPGGGLEIGALGRPKSLRAGTTGSRSARRAAEKPQRRASEESGSVHPSATTTEGQRVSTYLQVQNARVAKLKVRARKRGESTGDGGLPEPSPGHPCPGRPHQRHDRSPQG